MIIGVPKEIKEQENRVGLLPYTAQLLTRRGHTVLVQRDAGLGSGYPNEDYLQAGAKIVEKAENLFGQAEMIVKVKEPLKAEWGLLRKGQILFTYLHLAASKELTEALVRSGVTGVAYETIQVGNKLPLLEPMSEIAGRMSVVQDPQGAIFAVWQAGEHKGASVTGVPNSFCWGELSTSDTTAALGFYSSLFGWTTKPTDIGENPYTELLNNGVPIGGMMQLTEQMGDVPPHWLIYFAVANCDATVEKATALGSSIKVPPQDIPTVGRFAVVQDPQGAVFAVIAIGATQA